MNKLSRLSICLLAASAMIAPQSAYAQSADDEIITVGTLIKRKAQSDRSSPVVTLGAAELDSQGVKSIADLTQTLTINTGAENNPDAFTQASTTGTSNINLRGLGVQSTLVLLNGRRQVLSAATTNAGFNFVDTASLIPLIAVENVEILKDGASAIYGSDAVAGVANFSTYDNFDGVRLSGQYQTVAGEGSSDEILLQALVGKNFDRGNILGAVSYTDRSPLTTAERRLSQPADDTSALGNPGTFFPTAGPAAGTPLIDPGCAANGGIPGGIGALPDFVPGAALGLPLDVGSCGFDFGEFFNLVADEQRLTGYVQADFDITDDISWRGEFTYADNQAVRGNSPTFPFLQTAIVPGNNPGFLPVFGALGSPNAVVFFGRAIGNGGDVSPNETTSETWRFSTQLEGSLGNNGADWRLSYTQAENNHIVATEDTLVNEFRCALAGSCQALGGPTGFFNPFSSSFDTLPNSPEILDFIIGTATRDLTSELQVIDAVVTTPIGQSDAAIAFGVQYRSEDYSGEFDADSQADNFGFLIGEQNFAGDQNVYALFSEIVVPLSEQFELQAALRYEDYGDGVGDTLDPKIAFLFRPADYLSVRGSFSTSFRAPSVSQQFSQQTALFQANDQGATAFVAARTFGPGSTGGLASGAAALSPEQSEAFNLGVSFEPAENLEFDIDLYRFNFSDVITAENAQAVLDADPFDPERVVRTDTGTLVQINTNFVNAGSVETSGVDFGAKYRWDTDFGTVVPFVQGTWVFNYDLEDPQQGSVSGLGNRNFTNFGTSVPQLRFNTGFNWIKDAHRLDLFGRYIDSYEDDQNNNARVDSHFTVDARYALSIGELFDNSLVDDTALTVGVINAFDNDPPAVATNGGFDSRVHDPRGRLLYVGVDVTF